MAVRHIIGTSPKATLRPALRPCCRTMQFLGFKNQLYKMHRLGLVSTLSPLSPFKCQGHAARAAERAQNRTSGQQSHHKTLLSSVVASTSEIFSHALLLSSTKRAQQSPIKWCSAETAKLNGVGVRRLSHSSTHGQGCVLVGYRTSYSLPGDLSVKTAADGFAIKGFAAWTLTCRPSAGQGSGGASKQSNLI